MASEHFNKLALALDDVEKAVDTHRKTHGEHVDRAEKAILDARANAALTTIPATNTNT